MSCVLVTGSNGFIGKNLIAGLKRIDGIKILKYDLENTAEDLENYISQSDFIFHLAGVNRPDNVEDFKAGNQELTARIINMMKKTGKRIPILLASSIQAENSTPYGISKKSAEDEVFSYGKEMGQPVYVYRLANVFGKWCRPNYNSVVATWCYNIARNLPIKIEKPDAMITLVYIDDIVKNFIDSYNGHKEMDKSGFCSIPHTTAIKLQTLKENLLSFNMSRETKIINELSTHFMKCLYATYLSYLPEGNLSYELDMKYDNRGYLAEFIKSNSFGQIFVSRTAPGITRGNHYHHKKVEKFLVISGKAQIRLRNILDETIIEYNVNGNKLEVIDIPPGYTHNITNIGNEDVITLFWADELFDLQNPDTFFLEV